jgi:hypothetical protein
MRIYQNYVEASSEELNATRDTLKFLGFNVPQEHQKAQNGASSENKPDEPWNEKAGRAFTKALDDYSSTHKKVFVTMYEAGKVAFEDLKQKVGMSSDQLKASLASLTKIAHRGGTKRRPADWAEDGSKYGTPGVWEVDPGLRKVIEDHKLL